MVTPSWNEDARLFACTPTRLLLFIGVQRILDPFAASRLITVQRVQNAFPVWPYTSAQSAAARYSPKNLTGSRKIRTRRPYGSYPSTPSDSVRLMSSMSICMTLLCDTSFDASVSTRGSHVPSDRPSGMR